MNDIRKNTEQEEILIEGTFKLSPGAMLTWILGTIVLLIPLTLLIIAGNTMEGTINDEPASGWAIAFPFFVFFCLFFIVFTVTQVLKLIGIKRSQFVVTNKRIYGKYSILIARKTFSYRLDEIDNVEMVSTLGQHTLSVQFAQGHGPAPIVTAYSNGVPLSNGFNTLRMANLKNYKEVQEVLDRLITSRKNIIDVQTDIEMSKLDAENRKADALEHVAQNIIAGSAVAAGGAAAASEKSSTDYIDELKRLKQLLDDGIITQEEFDQEKKEILDNNHQ